MTVIFPYFDNGHFGKSQRSFWGSITVILVDNGHFGCITVILVQNNGHFGHDFFGLTVILVCPSEREGQGSKIGLRIRNC